MSLRLLAEQLPVGVEVEHRVVDGAAVLLALVDPHHQVDPGAAGRRTEALGHRPWHHHRLLQQADMPGLVLARQHLVDPGRPGGQERLGEDQQPRPVRRRLLDQRQRLLEAGFQVQEHRSSLDRGHLDLRLRHGNSPVGVDCDPLPLRRRGLVDDGLQVVHAQLLQQRGALKQVHHNATLRRAALLVISE
jgi:hypothetical protein